MKLFISGIMSILVAGCANVSKLNNVSTGQTKAEVIATMGQPDTVRATNNVEYLNYVLYTSGESSACIGMGVMTMGIAAVDCAKEPNYFVRLENGKVTAYGKIGDFDSTKNPTIQVEHVNQQPTK
ncbi:MAG: outer membrane protein assembly factor BamE [Gammaproteobacteria bacterium]|nr:outer membrane protein assembly factor BamE [Gammaproteobacteria bacterium]